VVTCARNRHIAAKPPDHEQVVVRSGAKAIGVEPRHRKPDVDVRGRVVEAHDTVALGIRQRPQQDAVHDAEDHGVGADA